MPVTTKATRREATTESEKEKKKKTPTPGDHLSSELSDPLGGLQLGSSASGGLDAGGKEEPGFWDRVGNSLRAADAWLTGDASQSFGMFEYGKAGNSGAGSTAARATEDTKILGSVNTAEVLDTFALINRATPGLTRSAALNGFKGQTKATAPNLSKLALKSVPKVVDPNSEGPTAEETTTGKRQATTAPPATGAETATEKKSASSMLKESGRSATASDATTRKVATSGGKSSLGDPTAALKGMAGALGGEQEANQPKPSEQVIAQYYAKEPGNSYNKYVYADGSFRCSFSSISTGGKQEWRPRNVDPFNVAWERVK